VIWDDIAAGAERTDEADAVVIAAPAPAMLEMYPTLDPTRRTIVSRIDYSRCIAVTFGLADPPPCPSSMLLIPRCEQSKIFSAMFEHRKAPGRAPDGKGLVTFYCTKDWSDAHWNAPDDEIAAGVRAAVRSALPGLLDSEDLCHVTRWDPFLAAGNVGVYRDLAALARDTDQNRRVHLAGDYLGFSTTGGAVSTGETAAAQVTRILRHASTVTSTSKEDHRDPVGG
jgi:oxygen-dependent protoporphyrinogen oxidase